MDESSGCVESQSIGTSPGASVGKVPQPPTPLKRRIRNWEKFQTAYQELTEVVIDGIEQSTQRLSSSKATKTILLEQTQTPYD